MVYTVSKRGVMALAQSVKSAVRRVHSLSRLVTSEIERRPEMSLEDRIEAYRHGFLSQANFLFDGYDEYLSNWQRERTRQLNGQRTWIHEDKFLWYYVFAPEFGAHLPDLYGYIEDGDVVDHPFADRTFDSLRDCVDARNRVVVKSATGAGGGQVHVIERTGDGYLVNGTRKTGAGIASLQSSLDDYLVTEFVEQGTYADTIYPDAANTLRILTMVDPETGDPYIGAMMHRFGTDEAAPLDNFAAGGISAEVDVETGRVGEAIAYPDEDGVPTLETHPDTDAQIAGVTIPGWDEVREGILEMAEYAAPATPYIGWDVVVPDDGTFVVIEANSHPNINALQAHTPLLADERNRRFYEHHGVV